MQSTSHGSSEGDMVQLAGNLALVVRLYLSGVLSEHVPASDKLLYQWAKCCLAEGPRFSNAYNNHQT